jgi:hypothetical protein
MKLAQGGLDMSQKSLLRPTVIVLWNVVFIGAILIGIRGWTSPAQASPTFPRTAASLQANGVITGIVFANDTGLPIVASVEVVAAQSGIRLGYWNSVENGYSLTLPPGVYKLAAYDDPYCPKHYIPQWYADQPDSQNGMAITVTSGSIITDINFSLVPGADIQGTVTTLDTHIPIPDVDVFMPQHSGSCAATDGNGAYSVGGLPNGQTTLYFRPWSFNWTRDYVGEDRVVAVIAPLTYTVDVTLVKGGQISGRVIDDHGDGLGGADAGVIQIEPAPYYYSWSTNTDAQGYYTIAGLPTGEYYAKFSLEGGWFDWPPYDYIRATYHDKPYNALGDPISVTVGEVTPHIDQVLLHGSQFAGKVTDASTGLPMDDVYITVYDLVGNLVSTGYTIPGGGPNGPGTYTTTPGLPSGSYRLRFVSGENNFPYQSYAYQFYRNQTTLASANPITVTARQKISGVNASLAPGGRITGTVTGTIVPPSGCVVEVYDVNGWQAGRVVIDDTGAYVASHLPTGRYRVKFTVFPPWDYPPCPYASQYYNNKTTLDQADWITVTVPTTTADIDAVMALPTPPETVSITGPVTGVTVVPVKFSATVGPLSATQPMTYVWSASELSDVVHYKEGYQDDIQFSWPTTGTKFITVTASNVSGSVTSNFTVTLKPAFQILLLPMFNGYYVPSSQLTP